MSKDGIFEAEIPFIGDTKGLDPTLYYTIAETINKGEVFTPKVTYI